MRQRLKNIFVTIAALTIIYLIVNLVHLSWAIAQPEGFWGIGYFIEVLFGIILLIIILVWVCMVLLTSLYRLITNFQENSSRRSLIRFLSYAIVVPVVLAFNFFWGNGISIYINKTLSEKYKYIKKSDEYFSKGAYVDALKFSEKVYNRVKQSKPTSKFYILTWLFEKTSFSKKRVWSEKYEAVLNHAYCLQFNDSLEAAKSIFEETIGLLNTGNSATKEDQRLFPILSLAQINFEQGNLWKANKLFNEALSSNNLYDSKEVETILSTREILAEYAVLVGDYRKASNFYIENLKLYESSTLSKKSSRYLATMLMACISYMRLGDMINAGLLIHKAEEIAESKSSKSIYSVFLKAKAYYCLASYLKGNGNEIVLEKGKWYNLTHFFSNKKALKERFIDEAEICEKEIIEREIELNGEENIQYAQELLALANIYLYKSNFAEAKKSFNRILIILDRHKVDNPNAYYTALLQSTLLEIYQGRNDTQLIRNLSGVQKFYLQELSDNYLFFTEDEKETYIANIEKEITNVNKAYLSVNSPNSAGSIYNNILATKGIALYSHQHIRKFLTKSDTTFRHEYSRLLHQKELLEKKTFSSDLAKEKERATIRDREKELISKVSESSLFKPFQPDLVKWEDVRDSLKDGELAVEFISLPSIKPIYNDASYYALILSNKSPLPKLIHLFNERDLLRLLNRHGDTKTRIDSIYGHNSDVYNLIFGPIEGELTSSKKTYFSLSGILLKVSFSALLVSKVSSYEIVSSTRSIAMPKQVENPSRSVVLFGDIDYGKPNDNSSMKQEQRSQWHKLQYSRNEIDYIDSIYKRKGNCDIKLFTGIDASKNAFLSLSGRKYNIIHLATHGFFYDNFVPEVNGLISNSLLENPLTRCGLAFAYANGSENSGILDFGILTAEEVSKMDLSGVELVVLSACQSGIGEVYGGEGVMGFQRAFAMAGAKNAVISLWDISDKHTAELMKYFYSYLSKGESTEKALKHAQLDMKGNNNSTPYFWAGFTAVNLN